MESQTNGFPPTKLRVVSSRKQIAIRTITRLLWWGFALYTVGLVSGFFTGHPLPRIQVVAAIALWLLYAAILQARHLKWLTPKRVAALCIIAFSAALVLLWGITFTAELHHVP